MTHGHSVPIRAIALSIALAVAVSEAEAAGWSDVTAGSLAEPGYYQGASWTDYDDDGDPDLVLAQEYHSPSLRLLRNDSGVFADATAYPLTLASPARGTLWGDLDNDGDPDAYALLRFEQNLMFRNAGSTFTAQCQPCVKGEGGGAWGDFDLDGDIDLVFVRFGSATFLYRNEGGSDFVLIATPGSARAALWIDYDCDGDLDLHLVGAGPDRLLRNSSGAFADVTPPPLADEEDSPTATWGDYDEDGDLDLYLPKPAGTNRIVRNDGAGAFTDVTASSPLALPGDSFDAAWVDVDNDGDLDLFVVRGTAANVLFRNDGGAFVDTGPSALDGAGARRAAAWADYDADGDLDVFLATDAASGRLIRNDLATGNHWLHVDLTGVYSNRSGIGARIRVKAGGVWRTRDVAASSAFSQGSITAEFGLGSATVADSVVVHWPSTFVQTLTAVAADRRITIDESPVTATPDPLAPLGVSLAAPVPNPSRGRTHLAFDLPVGGLARLDVVDVSGRVAREVAEGTFPPGRHAFTWDGRDGAGRALAAGVYWVRLVSGTVTRSRRLALLR